MDLAKVPNEKKLNLCRWYFRIGFAFLPFVWTVNVIWFFNEAFRKPEYEEQKHIRKYVVLSALGSTIWLVILITWVTIFQLNRANWGAFADNISFIIPVVKHPVRVLPCPPYSPDLGLCDFFGSEVEILK